MDLCFTDEDLALRDEIREFCRTAQPASLRQKTGPDPKSSILKLKGAELQQATAKFARLASSVMSAEAVADITRAVRGCEGAPSVRAFARLLSGAPR